MGIDNAGDRSDVVQNLCGGGVVEVAVGAGDTDVDRSGLAEVEYLVDDVGGLEEEGHLGKPLRQFAAQIGHVSCGR